jgi:hypothetical protein
MSDLGVVAADTQLYQALHPNQQDDDDDQNTQEE